MIADKRSSVEMLRVWNDSLPRGWSTKLGSLCVVKVPRCPAISLAAGPLISLKEADDDTGWLAGDKPYLALTRTRIHCVIINPFVVCILSTCLDLKIDIPQWSRDLQMVTCRHDIINTMRMRILRCIIVDMMYYQYMIKFLQSIGVCVHH